MAADELAALSVDAATLRDDPGQLQAVLAEHGVAVVTGLLGQAEALEMEALWQADLLEVIDGRSVTSKHAAAIRAIEGPCGIEAWPGANNDYIGHAKRGFATKRGMPHGRFAWACRLHPRVRDAFSAIHGVPPGELCTGVDNVMWQGFDAPAAESNTEWLHCDQNHITGLTWPIVQGIVYVRPSHTDHASTTVVWPRSHTINYDRIMADPQATQIAQKQKMRGQLIKLNTLKSADGRALHAAAVEGARRVPMAAGSLLLWDSRTTHQGWCGGPRLAQPGKRVDTHTQPLSSG
jgi:hypothetical protein